MRREREWVRQTSYTKEVPVYFKVTDQSVVLLTTEVCYSRDCPQGCDTYGGAVAGIAIQGVKL